MQIINSIICTNKTCNKKVPENRKKYCSRDCQVNNDHSQVKKSRIVSKVKMRKGFIKTKIPKTKQDKNKLVPIVATGMTSGDRMSFFSSMRNYGINSKRTNYRKQRVDHVYMNYPSGAFCLNDIEKVIKLIDKRHKETCNASYKYSLKIYLGYWGVLNDWLEKDNL